MDLEWSIPNEEKALDRLEELHEYLRNFPESRLTPVIRRAVADLEASL